MTAGEDDNILRIASRRVVVDEVSCPGIVEIDLGDPVARVRSIDVETPIADLDPSTVCDVGDALVVPAPFDLHFHGAGGQTVPPAGSAALIDEHLQLAAAERRHADPRIPIPHYEWLATLPVPTSPPADPAEHVAEAARSIAASGSTGCAGIRIEGLFLNPARAGVWPPETFRPLDVSLLEAVHAAAADNGSALRIIDIAPEMTDPAGLERFIARARELDIVVALAHTDATWEIAQRAIDAGATLATHLWNAMRSVVHRDPGVVAACLTDDRVTCELICDGVHLHPGTIQLSASASGRGGWAIVSDASPFAGLEPGEYAWAGTTVHHDGIALRTPEGTLAGSSSLAWTGLDVLARAGIDDLDSALALGAVPRRVLDPARTLGLHVGDPVWVRERTP